MLVQKGKMSKRTVVMLIVLGVFIIGGGIFYYFYTKAPSAGDDDSLVKKEPEINFQTRVVDFDPALFEDPRFFSLERNKFAGFTSQYEGVALSDSQPIPLMNISVSNPKMGNILVVRWQLPEKINFDKVLVYRSTVAGEKGEVVYQAEVQKSDGTTSSDALKIMNYQDGNLKNNQTYYYLVNSAITDEDGEAKKESSGEWEDMLELIQVAALPTDEIPPAPPENIQVRGTDDGAIKISWLNPVEEDFSFVRIYRSSKEGELGYQIYGARDGDIGLGEISGELSYYLDAAVEPNAFYYYTITSVDKSGNESSRDLVAAPFKPFLYNPFEPIAF